MATTSNKLLIINVAKLLFIVFTVFIPIHAKAKTLPEKGIPLPPAILGTWQVTKVHIDPAEKGRIIVINPEKMTHDGLDKMVCTHPTVVVKRSTAAALFKDSLGWRGFDPEIPTPKDYELPISNKTLVDSYWINCTKGHFGPGVKEVGENTWVIPLPNGQLAMLWYDDSILILSRLPVNAKPKPSFDCAKARTPDEKTICGSVSLSSFDNSVAESYANVVRSFKREHDSKGLNRLKTAQKAWLTKRNACGVDAGCIKKAMLLQLDFLMDPHQLYPQ